jgi:hypothetical protein
LTDDDRWKEVEQPIARLAHLLHRNSLDCGNGASVCERYYWFNKSQLSARLSSKVITKSIPEQFLGYWRAE